jgi:hypothetical protein
MLKYILKITFILCITVLSALTSKAQIGYDYAQYDLGVAVGANQVYGDIQSTKTTPTIHFNFNYNQTPFVNYLIEAQLGRLEGGDKNTDPYGRQFKSTLSAFAFRAQLQAGEFIDYSQSKVKNALKNLYISSGIGIEYTTIKEGDINRYSIDPPGLYTPGENSSSEIFIPARVGYELKFYNSVNQPSFKIDLGWQYNFILGDQLDGFKAGGHNDSYTQFTLGFKFSLGGVTSYSKQIYY